MRYFVILILVLIMTCEEQPQEKKCVIDEQPNRRCLAVETPVCGCDGKTYYNSCYATKNGVGEYTQGKCK